MGLIFFPTHQDLLFSCFPTDVVQKLYVISVFFLFKIPNSIINYQSVTKNAPHHEHWYIVFVNLNSKNLLQQMSTNGFEQQQKLTVHICGQPISL